MCLLKILLYFSIGKGGGRYGDRLCAADHQREERVL